MLLNKNNKKNVYKFIFVKFDSRYLAVRKNKVTAIIFLILMHILLLFNLTYFMEKNYAFIINAFIINICIRSYSS
jgi:hypothetical protein